MCQDVTIVAWLLLGPFLAAIFLRVHGDLVIAASLSLGFHLGVSIKTFYKNVFYKSKSEEYKDFTRMPYWNCPPGTVIGDSVIRLQSAFEINFWVDIKRFNKIEELTSL